MLESAPRRPSHQSIALPASDPRVAAVTGHTTAWGCLAAAVTTKMSLISGRLRNEASSVATRNKPTGPREGNRNVWIQRTILLNQAPDSGGTGARPVAIMLARRALNRARGRLGKRLRSERRILPLR